MENKYGFTLLASRPLPELQATLHEYEHTGTGAKLCWLERAEENKTFGIAFTTLPFDDTGVFHILEHSVLCGSERYPVKEPFVELLKHSMNTFLNAMTYPDKTLYPVSSRNNKDFLNLVRVYLDAVFFPNIYHKPEIFGQEGWHYEFDADGAPSYKGVVFNEMKGAFADADELMDNAINRALFPDSCYRYVAGGDPAAIPDLTYESFIASHKKFYAPSNSFIFLDGALDLDQVLAIIGGEYLARFGRSERIAPPAMQRAVNGGVQQLTYEVASQQEEAGHTRVAYGAVIGTYASRERIVGAQVLADTLCGSNQGLLTRQLLAQGLADNVVLQVMDGVSQPWLRLELRDLEAAQADEAERAMYETLEKLAQNGIDRAALEASMANLEFQMRERDFGRYPKGLVFCMQALESWLYGGAPEANLEVGRVFEQLRRKMDEGWFERLLRELLLQNPHRCKVVLTPSHTAGEQRRAAEAARLQREAAGWSEAQRSGLLAYQQALQAWQASENTPEQLATLPRLTLADIAGEPEPLPIGKAEINGIPTLLHETQAGGIAYLTMYFDAGWCSAEQLSCLAFLCRLLSELRTEYYTAEEINNAIRRYCGSMEFYLSTYTPAKEPGGRRTMFCVSFSTLEQNIEIAVALATEVLTSTLFSEESAVQDILRQARMDKQRQITMAGHAAAMGRVRAQLWPAGVAEEHSSGFAFYQWLRSTEQNWAWPALQSQLAGMLAKVAARERLTLSVTGNARAMAEQATVLLSAVLPARGDAGPDAKLAPWGVRREGITIPADISFAVLAGDVAAQGAQVDGVWRLAARIIGLAYLWNAIRVQGGAYGTGLVVQTAGAAACYSYRDPSGALSLQKYLQAPAFLRQLCEGEPDLEGFIIGAVSDSEPLLTPRMKGATADGLYWQGLSYADRCRQRRQLLQATPQQLAAVADVLQRTLQAGGVCVVGGENQLAACALDSVQTV